MAPRVVFANLSDGLQMMSLWDQSIADVSNRANIPCVVTGTANAIILTPVTAAYAPNLSYSTFYGQLTFVATATSTGNITVQVAPLAALNVYLNSTTQAGTGNIQSGYFYSLVYSPYLNGGVGGFFLVESSGATIAGPGSTTIGDVATWSGTNGTSLADTGVINVTGSLVKVSGSETVLLGGTGALTADGFVINSQNTPKTAAQIYQAEFGGSLNYDSIRAVMDIEASTSLTNANAFGAYVYNNVAAGSGTTANSGVGYFANVVSAATNAAVWGGNFALNDTLGQTGQDLNGFELDFTVAASSTNVAAIGLILQGSAQPVGADAISISLVPGSTAQWVHALVVGDGAITSGGAAIRIGAITTSGTSIASQKLLLGYFDAGGVEHNLSLQATLGGLNILASSVADGVFIGTSNVGNPIVEATGSDSVINLILAAKGAGAVVSDSTFQIATFAAAGVVTNNSSGVLATSTSLSLAGLLTSENATAPSSTALEVLAYSSTANLGIYTGTGVPSASAAQGSLYIRIDGGAATALYLNTSSGSGTTWTAVT